MLTEAVATSLSVMLACVAKAFTTVVPSGNVVGTVYNVLPPSGSLPSVVYRIVAPAVAHVMVNSSASVCVPLFGEMTGVATGATTV